LHVSDLVLREKFHSEFKDVHSQNAETCPLNFVDENAADIYRRVEFPEEQSKPKKAKKSDTKIPYSEEEENGIRTLLKRYFVIKKLDRKVFNQY